MTFSSTKYLHYAAAYARELPSIPVQTLLEIGIQKGGSLHAWKKLFPQAQITGIDIDPACKGAEAEGIRAFIGDQTDSTFLEDVGRFHGPFDVIMDDGGHWPFMQKASFKALWPYLAIGGVFVIEDLETAFNWRWLKRKGTFRMLARMVRQQTQGETTYVRIVHYPNIVFIHKDVYTKPRLVEFPGADCRGGRGIKGSTFWAMLKARLGH